MSLISVLIPVYNAEKFLPACLDSLLAQTFGEFEILCLDDGSSDFSPEILRNYARKDTRIKLLDSSTRRGISIVRNILIEKAKGTYITFVDADDFVTASFLEKMYSAARETNADIVRCLYSSLHMDDGQLVPCEKEFKEFYRKEPDARPISRLQAALDDTQVWLKLIKKSVITDNGIVFYPCIRSEDISFEILLYQYAGQITFLNEHLYTYRRALTSSLSSNKALVAYGTLQNMIFLCRDITRRKLTDRPFYEQMLTLLLHAIRRMRKYTFTQQYSADKLCREAFDTLARSCHICGFWKGNKYALACRIAGHLKDRHLKHLAWWIR